MGAASKCLLGFKNVLVSLLPTFLVPISWKRPQDRGSTSAESSKRSFRYTRLDGLRGLASLGVVFMHTLYGYSETGLYGDGISYETIAAHCSIHISRARWDSRSHLLQLPFIRILYNGPAGVAIFFIISGFVLTQGPLRYARQREWERALGSLSSATFRRPFRLYLPLIIGTFITMILTYFNVMDRGLHDKDCMVGFFEEPCPVFSTFFAQVNHWLKSFLLSINVWNWRPYDNPYDFHLWTISSELRGSLAIFTVTLATCRLRIKPKLLSICLLIVYCYVWIRWEMCLFLSGMLFAETSGTLSLRHQTPYADVSRLGSDGLPVMPSPQRSYRKKFLSLLRILTSQLPYYMVLLISLYLFSVPLYCVTFAPGYSFLYYISPKSLSPSYLDDSHLHLHHVWGAFLFVGLVVHWKSADDLSNPLARIFDTPFCQYLGRISYSTYIVHGPLLHLFGYRLFPVMWRITGRKTSAQSGMGWVMAFLIVIASVIWVADLFTRAIDEPCVRIAKRLEGHILLKRGENQESNSRETADTGRIRLD